MGGWMKAVREGCLRCFCIRPVLRMTVMWGIAPAPFNFSLSNDKVESKSVIWKHRSR